MTATVGILGVAKKVKRIYVGVDGKARRVKTVYGTRGNKYARKIFIDDEPLQFSIKGNYGNLSGRLAGVIKDIAQAKILISGTFVNKYTLSEISVSGVSGQAALTGRSVSLGSSTSPYTEMSVTCEFDAANVNDTPVLFSGAANGTVFIKKIKLFTMSEFKVSDADSSTMQIATGQSGISSNHQVIQNLFRNVAFPPQHYSVVNSKTGSITYTHTSEGVVNKSVVFSGYNAYIKSMCMSDYGYEGASRSIICTDSSTNKNPKIVTIASFYGSGDIYAGTSKIIGTYSIPNMPSSYSEFSVGTSMSITTKNKYGSYAYRCHASTISYQDSSKRYLRLIIDFGTDVTGEGTAATPVYDVAEYSESVSISSGNTRAKYYNWQILGYCQYDNSINALYVLSTVNDEITIIKFKIENGTITKMSEYDTGKRLSSTTVLNEIVPVVLDLPSYETRTTATSTTVGTHMLSFMLTVNNEYNEIVIVPRALIP